MQTSSTSVPQRQRLIARFNHLLRQYENLSEAAAIFAVFGGRPAEALMDVTWIKNQFVQQRAALEKGDMESARRGLGELTGVLQSAREALHQFDASVSAYLLRARYQQPGARREEVSTLLQFLLGKSPLEGEDFDKLDYLVTRFYALRSGPESEASSAPAFENLIRREYQIMFDQAGLTIDGAPNPLVMERFKFFREELVGLTTFEQFTTQSTLDHLRDFKAGLEMQWFYPDVLIEVARTNVLAGQRFQELANKERQQIDRLATQLMSVGVSEVEQPTGGGMMPVDDAKEISALNATLLEQDYRRNKERLSRLTQLRGSLERARGLATAHDKQAPCHLPEPHLLDEQLAELETILEELSPTPDRLQQDLRARLTTLSQSLSVPVPSPAEGSTIKLALDNSTLTLAPWERTAFQDEPSPAQIKEARLRRLVRVGVALMAELQEKAELISRGVMVGRLRNTYLAGARYLVQLSQQTARELELRGADPELAQHREVGEQLEQTRRKLLETCSQFSAKIRGTAH